MADKKIHLRVVSPTRIVLEDNVDMVIMRTVVGDIGILPGHEQVTTLLSEGILKYIKDDDELEISIHGGFSEVTPEKVTILTDAAELPNEIDKDRALRAKERAEERLKNSSKDIDIIRAEHALHRALTRLQVSETKK